MDKITVTAAGRLQYADGDPYCELVGYAVRRDGRELARFADRDEAEAHASKIAAFIRATIAETAISSHNAILTRPLVTHGATVWTAQSSHNG